MSLAATSAGIAFSRAGVHVPHALSYPIASLRHAWKPPGYGGAALVPHGFAVASTAPAVFRFIEDTAPDRCATAARLLDGGNDLAASFERLLNDIGAPTRLREVGYTETDLQHCCRVPWSSSGLLIGSPKPVGAEELEALLRASSDGNRGLLRLARQGRHRRSGDDGNRHLARVCVERRSDRARRRYRGPCRGSARSLAAADVETRSGGHRRSRRRPPRRAVPLRGSVRRRRHGRRRADRRSRRRAPRRQDRRVRRNRGGGRRLGDHRHRTPRRSRSSCSPLVSGCPADSSARTGSSPHCSFRVSR